jgi:hypothetical protein
MSKNNNITYYILRLFTFLLLSLFTLWIFFYTMLETANYSFFIFILMTTIIIFLITNIYLHFKLEIINYKKILHKKIELNKEDIFIFIFVVYSGITTYYLHHLLNFNSVLASGMVGFVGSIIYKRFAAPIFCGSFIAMASENLPTISRGIIIASVLGGIIYILIKDLFDGYGGKLGAIAFISSILTAIILNFPILSSFILDFEKNILIILYAILGAIITYHLNTKLNYGPIIASAIVGIFSGFFLPLIHGAIGLTYAALMYCGSFAGMSSKNEISNKYYILISGIICGFVFIFSTPFIDWAGGKLGAIAFGSILCVKGLQEFIKNIRFKSKLTLKNLNFIQIETKQFK